MNKKTPYFPFVFLIIASTVKLILYTVLNISFRLYKIEILNNYLIPILNMITNSRIDIFLSQLSTSFLVTSLLSFLGSKGQTIYWQDIIDFKLVKPKNRGFKDYTKYCFILVLCSLFFTVFNWPGFLFFSYLFNVIFLVLMTWKMVDIYYDKKSIKKAIIAEYDEASSKEKKTMLNILFQNTSIAIKEKNYQAVIENVDFLVKTKNIDKSIQVLKLLPYDETVLFVDLLRKINGSISNSESEKINKVIMQYMRAIIKNNGYIDLLTEYIFEPIIDKTIQFLDKYGYSLILLACQAGIKANKEFEDKNSVELNKQIYSLKFAFKPIELVDYAYNCGSYEAMESILSEYLKCESTYYNKICEISKANGTVSFPMDCLDYYGITLTSDEKDVLKNILKKDREQKSLTRNLLRLIHYILEDNNEILKPTDEELDAFLIVYN